MFDDEFEGQPTAPYWLAGLSGLVAPDPVTGWMDTDAALEALAWLGQQVFAQAQADRGFHTRASLQHQVEATAQVTNTLAATQAIRIAQFAATSVDYAVIRKSGNGGDRTEARWVGETAHAPVAALQGVPAGPGVLPGQTREVWHPLGYKADYADTELGAGLCLGPVVASNRVEEAIDAVTKTPRLLAEVGAGRFDAYRLAQVTRELVEAGDVTCARVEDELLTRGVTGWTARQVQARARTLVRRVDPAAARTIKKKRAKDAINVFTRPGAEDGTTEVQAILWSKDAAAAFAAVDDLARALHRDTTTGKTLAECRADAMVDLILGNTTVTTNLTLLAPVNTSMTGSGTQPTHHDGQPTPDTRTQATPEDEDGQPAPARRSGSGAGHGERVPAAHDGGARQPVTPSARTRLEADLEEQLAGTDWDREFIRFFDPPDPPIRVDLCPPGSRAVGRVDPPSGRHGFSEVDVPGIGMIPAETVQAMLHSVGATITRALVDRDTGTLVSASTRTYRPTTAIRRFVAQRDLHCRFPGCGRDAKYCDVDHVTPWPEGETTPTNLQLRGGTARLRGNGITTGPNTKADGRSP